jgi:hypothetical protein
MASMVLTMRDGDGSNFDDDSDIDFAGERSG